MGSGFSQPKTVSNNMAGNTGVLSYCYEVMDFIVYVYYKELEDSANQRHPSIILDQAALESLQLEVD